MRSLRGRLVAILLLVSAIGLAILAVITYAEQRSFLYERVDRQIEAAFGAVTAAIEFEEALNKRTDLLEGVVVPDGNSERQIEPGEFGEFEGSDDNSGSGNSNDSSERPLPTGPAQQPPGGEPPARALNLPPGTFGQRLDEDGNVIDTRIIAFGEDLPPEPDLDGVELTRQPQTIKAQGDDHLEYRAAKRVFRDGTATIVALPLEDTDQTLERLVVVELVVIAVVLTLLGVLAWLLVGIGLRPLNRMGETADAIAGGDLSHRVEPADERSEIGRLGLALNRMLHRLEEAFDERKASEDRLRQFLADASHELRTPLASIRGYAELHRMGATADEAEVERSMNRIEQESERMGVLVEDMLALARLDETHDHNYEPVDLAAIAKDAVDDAHAVAPDRQITFDGKADSTVNGSAHQLQQVVANLVRNAISHTPDDAKIEVHVARSGDDIRLDVRDHGQGLPAGVGDQIFERFWRAESGRVRGKAGSGLGLAIVAGIVDAHGGRVHAHNADDGNGAIFSVWLPVASDD